MVGAMNEQIIKKMYVGISLRCTIDLFFLVTSITYFQIDECKYCHHDKY